MKPRTKRFALIAAGIMVLAAAAAFVLNAFQSNLVFFFTPTQVNQGEAPKGRMFRAGGMVKEGSVLRDSEKGHFVVTDTNQEVLVHYQGMLPDLFKEVVPSILQTKKNVFSDEHEYKDYKAFMVNRALSFHMDCVLYANEMNLYPDYLAE